jgi:hypothetical protein
VSETLSTLFYVFLSVLAVAMVGLMIVVPWRASRLGSRTSPGQLTPNETAQTKPWPPSPYTRKGFWVWAIVLALGALGAMGSWLTQQGLWTGRSGGPTAPAMTIEDLIKLQQRPWTAAAMANAALSTFDATDSWSFVHSAASPFGALGDTWSESTTLLTPTPERTRRQ